MNEKNVTEEQVLIVDPADEVISYTADRTLKDPDFHCL